MKWRKNRSYRLTRHPQYWGKEGNSALKRVLATRMASRMKKPSSHTQTEETSQAARTGEVSEKQLACPSSEPKDNRRRLCDPRTRPSNTGIRPTSVHKCEKVKPSYSREEEKVPVMTREAQRVGHGHSGSRERFPSGTGQVLQFHKQFKIFSLLNSSILKLNIKRLLGNMNRNGFLKHNTEVRRQQTKGQHIYPKKRLHCTQQNSLSRVNRQVALTVKICLEQYVESNVRTRKGLQTREAVNRIGKTVSQS